MSYRHDIFISYKWEGDIKEWVDSIFLPILRNELEYLKGGVTDDDIFRDIDQTQSGASVPDVLRDGVAYSKCMICVISRSYFTNSTWCPSELSAMLKREEETKIKDKRDHVGLIFPLIFMDESAKTMEDKNVVYKIKMVKELLFKILPLNLNEEKYYRITGGFRKSDDYDDLRKEIRDWVKKSILPVIEEPPEWQEDWKSAAYFDSIFNYQNEKELIPLPRL